MKKLILSVAAIAASSMLFAQTETNPQNASDQTDQDTASSADVVPQDKFQNRKRAYIGITVGPSIPLGDFASETNGGAKTGINLGLVHFGYRITDYLGVAASWIIGANGMETSWGKTDDSWGYWGITVGPLFSFPISQRFELDLKPMVGYSVATLPDIGDGIESSTSFAYMGSVMGRYHLGSRISLIANVDYFHTEVSFEDYDVKQKISTLSVGVGVAYRFK